MGDWVDSGWNSKKLKIVKEQFENQPNYRALDGDTDRYCRIAGSLNPNNPDSPARSELMGIYANGYAGLKQMPAVKKYLTDTYDKAVNPSLDLNKSDAEGGRQDSWKKCFGTDIQPVPIVEKDTRYDSSRTVGSTFSNFQLPSNPGQLPVFAMAEAISVGNPRNIWAPNGTSGWTQNAVPGAMWIWGTPDAYVSTPMNQTFIFYYNFIHTANDVEGTLVGSIDNTGSITINGNMKDNLGGSITPYQVTIKKGANTIAVRGTNLGTSPNPAGLWIAIKAPDGTILVKTDSNWRCNKYYYPAEVFHLYNYVYTRAEAEGFCRVVGGTMATKAQLAEAQKAGADWCSTGWVADDDKTAYYPITTSTGQGCGNGRAGIMNWNPPSNKAGINCFGLKPAPSTVPAFPVLKEMRSGIQNFNQSAYSRYPS